MSQEQASTGTDLRQAYFWRNLAANLVAEGFWGFAMACVSVSTVLVAFLRRLGTSDFLLGLLPGIGMLGFAILQLPGALYFRRHTRRKGLLILTVIPITLLQFGLAAVAHYLAPTQPRRAVALCYALLFLQALFLGLTGPLWTHLLHSIFPSSRRGRAMGVMALFLSGMGLVGGLYTAALLRLDPEHPPFDVLFTVAAVMMALNGVAWLPIVETPLERPSPPLRLRRTFAVLFRPGSAWRSLVIARWWSEIARAPLIFATVVTLTRFHLPDSTAGVLTFMLAAGGAVAAPLFGWLGDRRGHKSTMVASAAVLPLATVLVVLAPHPWVAMAAFGLMGAVPAGDFLGSLNLVIESAPEEDKSIYAAVMQTAMVPARLLGPLASGFVAQQTSPLVVLVAALAIQLIALFVTVRIVVEPRMAGDGLVESYPSAGG
ncbi:MAG: MFS transporter [Armatimonadetes bacterium]|nr:MFS transporter [Armatimonadota bacterium]